MKFFFFFFFVIINKEKIDVKNNTNKIIAYFKKNAIQDGQMSFSYYPCQPPLKSDWEDFQIHLKIHGVSHSLFFLTSFFFELKVNKK